MDTLRGGAMLLLLTWHASSIPEFFGFEMPRWLLLANEVFLPWRMPTLMLLSGLLLDRSLRKTTGAYFSGKVSSILWPYLLWSAIHILTFPGFDTPLTDPKSWIGTGYLWFLSDLFVFYCIAPLVSRIPWWIVLPVLLAASVLLTAFPLQRMSYFAIFFFTGYYVRMSIQRITLMRMGWLLACGAVGTGFTAVSLAMSAATGTHYFKYDGLTVPFSICLILASVRAAGWLDFAHGASRAVLAVSWVGRNSIVFYLTHFPVMSVVCLVAGSFVGQLEIWIVPACWGIAILLGVAIARSSRRPAVSWLFSAPHRARVVRKMPLAADRPSPTDR